MIHPSDAQIIMLKTGSVLVRLFTKKETDGDIFTQFDVKFLSEDREDFIFIPSNTYHLIENVGFVPVTAIAIYSPVAGESL